MATTDLEARILSGEFFSPPERSSSPTRSVSTPSPTNTDDELGSDLSAPPSPTSNGAALPGMPERAGAQTGVKGVIRDAEHQKAVNREMNRLKVNATNAGMEGRSFQAQTIEEEDRDRKAEAERRVGGDTRSRWLEKRREELQSGGGFKRGGLREIGEEGFVDAVERPGWVVVLVYEPDVPRCQPLLQSILQLHLSLRSTPSIPLLLLKARATSLSFSLLPSVPFYPAAAEDEEEEDDDDLIAQERRGRRADPDVLPSMLVYRDGDLEKTWIRVDWEVGGDGAGLEGLLRRNGILTGKTEDGQADSGDDE